MSVVTGRRGWSRWITAAGILLCTCHAWAGSSLVREALEGEAQDLVNDLGAIVVPCAAVEPLGRFVDMAGEAGRVTFCGCAISEVSLPELRQGVAGWLRDRRQQGAITTTPWRLREWGGDLAVVVSWTTVSSPQESWLAAVMGTGGRAGSAIVVCRTAQAGAATSEQPERPTVTGSTSEDGRARTDPEIDAVLRLVSSDPADCSPLAAALGKKLGTARVGCGMVKDPAKAKTRVDAWVRWKLDHGTAEEAGEWFEDAIEETPYAFRHWSTAGAQYVFFLMWSNETGVSGLAAIWRVDKSEPPGPESTLAPRQPNGGAP